MTIKKTAVSSSSRVALVAAVADYQKAAKSSADAFQAATAADLAAKAAQESLQAAREEVARLMRKANLRSARCAGLLLAVDDEGLSACQDHFVDLSA